MIVGRRWPAVVRCGSDRRRYQQDAFDVTFLTVDGTARGEGTGVGSNDFQGTTSGVLSFGGNATTETQQISIAIDDDAVAGRNEQFFVNLIDATSNDISFADASATGTTENDDSVHR
ncbi:MAG: Calx-beta domain-containing protein [Pirellulaceae bacterium]